MFFKFFIWHCCSKPVLSPKPPSSRFHAIFYRTKAVNPSNLPAKVKRLAKNGFFNDALHLYRLLRASGTDPTNLPIVYALKACGRLSAIPEGLSIHAFITKAGLLHQNLTLSNSLIEMYSAFARIDFARQVFDVMPQRNSASWNLMALGYGSCSQPAAALDFCSLMKHNGAALDSVGFKIILPICGRVKAIEIGESIHGHLVSSGASNTTALGTAILDMYAKCDVLGAAEKAFGEIVRKDAVTWNAMITGYSQARKHRPLLELLNQMLARGYQPSRPTMLLSIQACTQLSSLKMGMAIHGRIISNGLSLDVSIQGLLVDMYSKCGLLCSACRVFGEVTEGRVNTWSCMINGLGIHGYLSELFMLFFQMLKHGLKPDDVCFLILLSTCSHWGLAEKGWKVFYYMFYQFGITPSMEHWAAMVDLMGRGGRFNEALRFMNEMPLEPGNSMIGAFLGACRIHGNLILVKEIGDWLIERGCVVAGLYKLLVGFSAGEEQWNEVISVRQMIELRKLGGNSGTSLIEVSSRGLA